MFYDTSLFPWIPELQTHWQDMRDELIALTVDEFVVYPERQLYDNSWKVFGLYGWGVRFDRNCDLCPRTAKLLEVVPGLANAGFSRLGPKTHIRPHNNAPEGLLRLHLPLICPEGCRLRVRDEIRAWKEGECMVFDDCLEHEAWNTSDRFRTVLLVDFPAHDLVVAPFKRRIVETWVKRALGRQIEYNYRTPSHTPNPH